jgi:predicted nucleic acid-binding protein
MGNKFVIFDTSVFIDHLRTNKYKNRIPFVSGLIRNSAVVLSELFRGATKPEELAFIKALAKNHPILTPSEKTWLESGEILSRIYRD